MTDWQQCRGECGEPLPVSEFGVKQYRKDGTPRYYTKCRKCRSAEQKNRNKMRVSEKSNYTTSPCWNCEHLEGCRHLVHNWIPGPLPCDDPGFRFPQAVWVDTGINDMFSDLPEPIDV